MYCFKAFFILALATVAFAQSTALYFLGHPSIALVGQPLIVRFRAPMASEPVTILLRKGTMGNLQTVATLTSSASNGSYRWTPSKYLSAGNDYVLEIIQGQEFDYTPQFSVANTSLNSEKYSSPSVHSQESKPSAFQKQRLPAIVTMKSVQTNHKAAPMPTGTASGMSTIPISRNTTFVSPTLKPTSTKTAMTTVTPTGGSSGGPNPSGNDATAINGHLSIVLGIFVTTVAYLF